MATSDDKRPASAENVKEAFANAIARATTREVLLTVGIPGSTEVIFFCDADEFPNLEITVSDSTHTVQTYTVPYSTQSLSYRGKEINLYRNDSFGSLLSSSAGYCTWKVVGIRSGGGNS